MRTRFYVPIFTATFLALAALLPVSGNAQGDALEGITIRPSLFEFRVEPGQTIREVIHVTNSSEQAQTFYSSVRDIESMNERGAPIWSDPNAEKSGAELSSWLTYSANALFLRPGETRDVTMIITVPKNAPHGGAFGLAAFVKEPPDLATLDGGSGLGIGFTTGALVALSIGEDIVDEAAILEFNADPRIGGGPGVTLHTRIENSGNALIRPIGTIEVSDMFGRFTSSVSFNPNEGAILPASVRQYETDWQGEGFLFGRYSADIFISYGTAARKTLVGTTSFWILPSKPLLFGLGGALIAFLMVFAWVRSYVGRRLREAGQSGSVGSRPSSFVAVLVSALIIAALALAFAFIFLA